MTPVNKSIVHLSDNIQASKNSTRFKISKDRLIQIVSAAQDRNFAEEIDLLFEMEPSIEYFMESLRTDF